MHALCGNGRGSSKGKTNKGSQMQNALNLDREVQYMEEVRNALPEAAKIRMMPQLVQSEWSAPIRSYTDMSDEGGVCIVHKDQVPTVLRAVGYTLAPTAILTTQHAQALGLKHYPCAKVTCLLRVRDEHGDFIEVTVQRHLIQLSFGPPVTMAAEGEQILLAVPMHRVVIKMPACFGWTPEALTGASIAAILARHVPAPACEDILVRQDASLDQALDLASKNDHCYGIAAKNAAHKPRFALRFLDVHEFRSAAKKLGLPDSSELGRWRLSGLPVQCGMAGALTLLESKQWQVVEILYFSEVQCVFLSKTPGSTGPMFYQQAQGHRKQLVFKALNALARQQLADANKNARASAAAPPQDVALAARPSRAVERDRWLRQVVPPLATRAAGKAEEVTPRHEEKEKRPSHQHTGEMPDAQRMRTN
ncbi:unnamed protein product [Symbiodinium natans]|uniref:Uncharacterized protein n=1 Tax=Symbiodinium natans TaxID=878477 RepID=A0A812V2U4_9DINO|nr:unnamed protein product [Symbiodinium natans]